MKLAIKDYDIVYLSYDEPNAEQNYRQLLEIIPSAKRIHGIKGSDSAHKACAQIATTERFITVDGDNVVRENFLDEEIDVDDDVDLETTVFSWCGKNSINGLVYGNGGIKCWPKQLVLDMKTHENADPYHPQSQVDFCWDLNYYGVNKIMSDVHNNATPQQAWRAGFREGVKMSLNNGLRQLPSELRNTHWKNLHRLYIWLMVGADVENGRWAIYGAREGLYKTMCTDWDFVNVRDFEWLNEYWDSKKIDECEMDLATDDLGDKLIQELNLPIAVECLNADQSSFFKKVYLNPSRTSDRKYILS
jgi:hypothetical protein